MIVSVMGAVFNILLAFVLSCVLWFFGYERRDGELTTNIGYVADTVERWNPYVEKSETVPGPAFKAGILPGDEIIAVDGSPVEDFMDIQSRIVTGKLRSAQDRRLTRLTIMRNGQEKRIDVFLKCLETRRFASLGLGRRRLFSSRISSPTMPAIKAGL
jgi:hypothetical protein